MTPFLPAGTVWVSETATGLKMDGLEAAAREAVRINREYLIVERDMLQMALEDVRSRAPDLHQILETTGVLALVEVDGDAQMIMPAVLMGPIMDAFWPPEKPS